MLDIHHIPCFHFQCWSLNQLHIEEEAGGVLVFLPGQDDIEALTALLEEYLPQVCQQRDEKQRQQQQLLGNKMQKHSSNTSAPTATTATTIAASPASKDFELFPLYASLTPEDQMAAFAPSVEGKRKFVLATNIAETSVTVAGIKYGKQ